MSVNYLTENAWKTFLAKFKGKVKDVTVPVQCEEFIQVALETEPEKVQLHYCSGLINYHAKKDSAGAIRDFTTFLDSVPIGAFEYQHRNIGKPQGWVMLARTFAVEIGMLLLAFYI